MRNAAFALMLALALVTPGAAPAQGAPPGVVTPDPPGSRLREGHVLGLAFSRVGQLFVAGGKVVVVTVTRIAHVFYGPRSSIAPSPAPSQPAPDPSPAPAPPAPPAGLPGPRFETLFLPLEATLADADLSAADTAQIELAAASATANRATKLVVEINIDQSEPEAAAMLRRGANIRDYLKAKGVADGLVEIRVRRAPEFPPGVLIRLVVYF